MSKMIHAIWLGKKMPPLSHACINDWKKQNYEVRLWTDSSEQVLRWIEECEFTKECYKRGLFAFVSDYLRVRILHEYGGLYLDTDVTIVRDPFELFADCDFCVGLENDSLVGTAAIYSIKSQEILGKLLDFYQCEIMSSALFMGPDIMTNTVEDFKSSDAIKILKPEYFFSYQGQALEFEHPENAYVVHWYQHTWENNEIPYLKSKHKGLLGKIYEYQKPLFRWK
ncbi:TcdA/TcdB catalytic glycosyltransferase domain-containing protein [Vibrio penaeicida]|uniref:glycosyltransferase family 32 protein n=1 Tax=Vibrio penaeicida TaxID=104609 RepID=UPI002732BF07|nr:TcdA/TcdB catalytic glycosyltransferase domain-containing protein [Vibrio penaeicida]MDP2573102.1 TcdA/TcdB catalytic glycosyltransferase domain-containing protein [Vibrio penaeicida]